MLILDATTKSLEVATTTAASLDYNVAYADHTVTGATLINANGNIASATTTTIVAAPAASTQRQITALSLRAVAAANTVTVKVDQSGAERTLIAVTLAAGESLHYASGRGWYVMDAAGRAKAVANADAGYAGFIAPFLKVGSAAEAAGQWYCWAKDSGAPGAWAPGTPGLAGRATDGTAAADNGSLRIPNPGSGVNYLTQYDVTGTVAHSAWLFDVLWVNTAVVVTTLTAQTINSVALPARDANGSTNGEGVLAGILVTTTTTNAGAITNTTLSYTNSDGTAGRTATMASFPITAVLGTVVWFQLQAGDKGVRSIQTVTLGTSYGGGAISLIMARPLQMSPALIANVGSAPVQGQNPGVRLYNGTCALPFGIMSAATATTINGRATVMER